MTKIKAGVIGEAVERNQPQRLLPASAYRVADIFGKINAAERGCKD